MAYKKTKSTGGGLKNPLRNDVVTTNELQVMLKSLAKENEFYELEALEVMDIYRANAQNGITVPGVVKGRYVISQQGKSIDEMNIFYPINSNVLQFPVVGDLLVAMTFKGNHYYLGQLSHTDLLVNPDFLRNFNQSGVGNTKSISAENQRIPVLNSDKTIGDYKSGEYFKDTFAQKLFGREGSTIIQGRFGNSIHLGSNQVLGEENSPHIKLVSGLQAGEENLSVDMSSVYITTAERIQYSLPTRKYEYLLNTDYSKPQIVFDSDRIVLNAKQDDIGIFAEGDIHIKGKNINIENANAINMVFNQKVDNYTRGVKKEFTQELDGDTKLLPENIISYAEAVRPKVENIQQQLQSAANKILPPVVGPGIPNPLNLLGHLSDLKFFQKKLPEIDDFFSMDWLDKKKWKTVSLNDVKKALGLDNMSIDFPVEWDTFLDDVDKLKDNIAKSQAQVLGTLAAVEALNAAFDAIQNGGGSTQTIIEALDAYEADPNNPPIDTTDIRDVISDGASNDDLKRYLDQGGSPQVREALLDAQQAQQDLPKLDQITQVVELVKMGENI